MAGDPCMFCGELPCICTGNKKTGLTRKPLAKREPEDKPKVERPKLKSEPKPRPVKPAPPKLTREKSSVDPELEQLVRTLGYLDMLHPDEKAKYGSILKIQPTTGRLRQAEDMEEGGETEDDVSS